MRLGTSIMNVLVIDIGGTNVKMLATGQQFLTPHLLDVLSERSFTTCSPEPNMTGCWQTMSRRGTID